MKPLSKSTDKLRYDLITGDMIIFLVIFNFVWEFDTLITISYTKCHCKINPIADDLSALNFLYVYDVYCSYLQTSQYEGTHKTYNVS